MRIFVTAYLDSQIDAVLLVEGTGRKTLEIPFTYETHLSEFGRDTGFPDLDGGEIKFTVRSRDRRVSIFTRNMPPDGDVHVVGVNRDLVLGMVDHSPSPPRGMAPRCELRCTPESAPVVGPDCISCKVGSLEFKICC